MSITRDDVRRVADLAELAVSEEELPRLVEQVERIVAFVEQLGSVEDDANAGEHLAGPTQVTLRSDEVRPAVLAHPVASMAPEFRDGFFTVPVRGGLEGEE